jgi:hypothetical protein
MRFPVLPGFSVLAWLAPLGFAAPADAYMLVPDVHGPGIVAVLIEREYGDIVELSYLPKPHDRLATASAEANGLAFYWFYRRIPQSGGPQAHGRFLIDVDAAGKAIIHFDFFGRELAEGAVYAAAAALLGRDRRAIHTFYARAETEGGGFDENHGRVALALQRSPAWWNEVSAIAFFYMQYPHAGELGETGVGHAMRRAVARLTGGEGVEQEE